MFSFLKRKDNRKEDNKQENTRHSKYEIKNQKKKLRRLKRNGLPKKSNKHNKGFKGVSSYE